MATFDAVLKDAEGFVRSNAVVVVDYKQRTVSITKTWGGEVLVQGEDAEVFINGVRELSKRRSGEIREACEYVVAFAYLDLQ